MSSRTLAGLAWCVLALAAAGCGDDSASPPEQPPPATAPAEPPAEPPAGDTDTGEAEPAAPAEEPPPPEEPPPSEEPPTAPVPGTLVVALNMPSPGFQVGAVDGEQVVFAKGFEVELARALVKELGSRPRLVQVERFRDLFSAGEKPWDLALAEVTITPRRDRQVDFSEPYLTADQGVLLRKGLGTRPASIADLRSLQLCTQARTTASDLIRNVIEPTVPARRFTRLAVLFREVQAGGCDAAILDAPVLGAERAQLPFRYGPLAGVITTGEQYGIVLPDGSPLREQLDGALAQLVEDGTLERLSTTWLSTDLSELPILE